MSCPNDFGKLILENMKKFICQKLEFFTGSTRQIIGNAFLFFALRILQKLLGLAALYFVVRAIDQDMYGQYQFIISVVAIVTIFSLPETNNAITQSVARHHLGTFRLVLPYAFVGSILGSFVLFGMAGWYEWVKNSHHMAAGFTVAAVLFPFAKGLTQWGAVKTGMENFSSLVKWDGSVTIFMQIMVVVGVLLKPGTFLVPLFCIFSFPALQNLFLTWKTYGMVAPDASVEKGSLRYGLKTTLYSFPVVLSKHIDKFMIFYFLSPEALALFAAAEKIPELTKNMVQDIAAVLAPRFARYTGYTARLDHIFKWFSTISFLLIVFIAFTILPWVFTLLFGETYNEAVPYAIALMCSVAVGNAAILRTRFIRSQLDANSMRNINLIMAFVRIVAAVVFVPLWGVTGAIMSVFLSRFVVVITVNMIIRKKYPLQIEI